MYVGSYNILYVYKVPGFTKLNLINHFGTLNIHSVSQNVISIIQWPFEGVVV